MHARAGDVGHVTCAMMMVHVCGHMRTIMLCLCHRVQISTTLLKSPAPLIGPAMYVSTVDMLLCIVVWCDENVGALLPCMHIRASDVGHVTCVIMMMVHVCGHMRIIMLCLCHRMQSSTTMLK